MESLFLLIIPGFIVFDLLPKLLGFKGLSDWYSDKYKKDADILLAIVYLPFTILIVWLIYQLKH